jgi:hypothetical protein
MIHAKKLSQYLQFKLRARKVFSMSHWNQNCAIISREIAKNLKNLTFLATLSFIHFVPSSFIYFSTFRLDRLTVSKNANHSRTCNHLYV